MSIIITSLQNERVKEAVKLRDRRGRDKQRRILIDGWRAIRLATTAGLTVDELFLPADRSGDEATLLKEFPAADLRFSAPLVMDKLSYGDRSEEAIAVATPLDRSLTAWADRSFTAEANVGPLLVLEGIEKPGNIGAILRTADAAGVAGVILAACTTDLYNPNTIRASRGAIFTVPVAVADVPTTRDWLRARQFRLYAARVGAAQTYDAVSYAPPAAIVLGAENAGLSAAWRGAEITPVALPMLGQTDSLNVSVAAAVLCYEALRQRRGTQQRA